MNTLTTTQSGTSTTSISHDVGLRNFNLNGPLSGMTRGFITSREALSSLCFEPPTATVSNTRKRKADLATCISSKSAQPKQATLKTWITRDIPAGQTKLPTVVKTRSSGIIHDRGKPMKNLSVPVHLQESSSPDRGYDVDSLPAISFSSPNGPAIDDNEIHSPLPKSTKRLDKNDLPISLSASSHPVRVGGMAFARDGVERTIGASNERRSLGIRRGMKPWSSKKPC